MIELNAYQIALIGVASALLGSLLGSLLSYRLALKLASNNAKREAAQKFISTFHRELADIYPHPIKWPKEAHGITAFLESKFSVLNAAVGEFRRYIPSKEWEGFDKAWFSYYNATGRDIDNTNCQCYLHYLPFEGTSYENGKEVVHDTTKIYMSTFKNNVDNILAFAKIT